MTCPIGKYLFSDNSCGDCDEINDNVLIVGSKCLYCHNSCSEGCISTDEKGCKKCKNGLAFKKNLNGDKLCEKCPSVGFFEENSECIQCHDYCERCEGN